MMLYTHASNTEVQKKRKRNIWISIVVNGLVLYTFWKSGFLDVYYTGMIGVFMFFNLFVFAKKRIELDFKSKIAQMGYTKGTQPVTLEFTEDGVIEGNNFGISRTYNEMVEEFVELKNHYLISYKSSNRLPIPKAEIPDVSEFEKTMAHYQEQYQTTITRKLDWKW